MKQSLTGILRDGDDADVISVVVQWAEANDLRPMWVPAGDCLVQGDTIHFREIVPAPGEEDARIPNGVADPSSGDGLSRLVTKWQTAPLVVHPDLFGVSA